MYSSVKCLTVADRISRTDDGAAAPSDNDPGVSWDDHAGDDSQDASPRTTLKQSRAAEWHGDHGEVFKLTRATYLFAACAALNSCNLGYDIGVNTDAASKLQRSMDLTDVKLELFMGSLNLFAMIGALGSHFASDRLGRRGAFLVAAIGFLVGIFIMICSQQYATLMAGRVFVGLGVGFGLAVSKWLLRERMLCAAPLAHRMQIFVQYLMFSLPRLIQSTFQRYLLRLIVVGWLHGLRLPSTSVSCITDDWLGVTFLLLCLSCFSSC